MTHNTSKGLKGTILFASAMLSIAILFNGFAYLGGGGSGGDVDEKIEAALKDFKAPAPSAPSRPPQPTVVEGDLTDDDAMLGDKNAPVTMIEFSDYECPFCKRHYTQTLPQIKEKYIDTGKVRLVFRDFPLGFHDPIATEEAMAAECAREQGGDKMYFTFHDLIFDTTNSNKGLTKDQLYILADEAGINKAKFTDCLDSEKYKDEVRKDIADGGKIGVSGTPAFFINGKFLSGAQPFSAFEQAIEAELK